MIISREAWLKEAIDCEYVGALVCCDAIVQNTIHLGVDNEDLLITLLGMYCIICMYVYLCIVYV